MSKSFMNNKLTSSKTNEVKMNQIIETARSIIEKNTEDGYPPQGHGRHPIFGYINFVVRRFIYNDVFSDLAKERCRRLSDYSIVNMNNWLLSFPLKVIEPEEVFGRPIYLNHATDPLISAYDTRCSVVQSFTEPGIISKVNPDKEGPGIILMLPFGVGFTSNDCHDLLSLNLRGEYKSRIREIYDYSDVVKQWEYRDGNLVDTLTHEKKDGFSDSAGFMIDLMGILFSIGKMIDDLGIRWQEYSIPENG